MSSLQQCRKFCSTYAWLATTYLEWSLSKLFFVSQKSMIIQGSSGTLGSASSYISDFHFGDDLTFGDGVAFFD